MRAVILEEPRKWRVTEFPDPTPRDGEVVIAVKACGVCGTDRHIFDGDIPAGYPLIPGHELAGEVIAVGGGVQSVKVGDLVAVHPNKPCRLCAFCREGTENLCENLQAYGVHIHGGFAQFVVVSEENVHPADGLTPSQAAWAEPLSCCLHGLGRVSVPSGSKVLVLGCGPIGLLFIQLLILHGAGEVVAIDPAMERREAAKRNGASLVLTPDELSRQGKDFAPTGFPLVVEASGNPEAVRVGLEWVRAGGQFLQFGVCPPSVTTPVSPYAIYRKEITLIGSFSLDREMPKALALLRSRRIKVDALTTHQLPLEGYGDALALMQRGNALKVQINP